MPTDEHVVVLVALVPTEQYNSKDAPREIVGRILSDVNTLYCIGFADGGL